jgi:type I restriction enzyme, S subunit
LKVHWPQVTLGDIARLVRRPVEVNVDRTYPELGVRSFGRGTFHKPALTGADVGSKRLFRIERGDLLFQIVFAWEGAVAVAGAGDHGRFGSHRFLSFVPNPDRALSAFLKAWFVTPAGLEILGRASPGGAGRNRTLGLEAAKAMPVPLPPLDVQHRIVERIDAVEGRIARRQRLAEAVDAELATLLSAAFHRITDGAPHLRMGTIAPLVRRPIIVDLEGSYPELGVRSFGKGTFHKPPLTGAQVGTKRLFEVRAGDLVFSNVFAWEGAVAVAEPDDNCRVGSHRFITRVADATRSTARFLNFWFLTPEGLQKLGEASPGGAGRNRTLGLDALDAIEVPVPSLDAQRWFNVLQQKARAARNARAAASDAVDHLLPALLEDAFDCKLKDGVGLLKRGGQRLA